MKVAVFLKQRLKRLVLGPRASGEDMIEYLRGKGMVIGRDTVIHDVRNVFVDPSRPWMIEIGNNVQITRGVTILTHGYDWSVFKGMYGDVLGSAGRVKIGDNVFIGMNTTILKGVTIGDNVVIGANSLINKDVPSNSVVVGNPQRVVGDVGSYLEKRRRAQIEEVSDLYSCWRRNSPEGMQGCVPPKRIFHEFFWLFEDRGGRSRNLCLRTSCIFAELSRRAANAWTKWTGPSRITRISLLFWTPTCEPLRSC